MNDNVNIASFRFFVDSDKRKLTTKIKLFSFQMECC